MKRMSAIALMLVVVSTGCAVERRNKIYTSCTPTLETRTIIDNTFSRGANDPGLKQIHRKHKCVTENNRVEDVWLDEWADDSQIEPKQAGASE